MCNQSKLTARHQVRVTSRPGSLKAREAAEASFLSREAAAASFLSFSKALCVCQPLRMLHSQREITLFEEGVFTSVPRGAGPASSEVERWLCS